MQKSSKKDEAEILFEENIYRLQLIRSHGHLGKDHVDKYDTGEEM